MHFKGRNIVSIDEFTTDEIFYLIKKSAEFDQRNHRHLLEGNVLASAFFEDSTRTRISFQRASQRQAMDYIGFSSAEGTSLSKNESTHHSLQMLAGYDADVIVLRHPREGSARYIADVLNVPVINGGDGGHEHPTQALLDMFTIYKRFGRLDNLNIALVGDLKYGRTVHSLIKAMRKYGTGNTFYLVSPEQLRMPFEYLNINTPEGFVPCSDAKQTTLEEALSACDVAYMTRIQLERIDERERAQALGKITLSASLLERYAKEGLIVMHPLPNDADHPTIDPDVDFTKWNMYFEQAANGVPMRETLLCAVLGAIGQDFAGKGYAAPVRSIETQFDELPIAQKSRERSHPLIYSIENGVVIDHIPPGLGLGLFSRFRHDGEPHLFATGLVTRYAPGSKDLVKLVDYELGPGELNMIGILAPTSQVSLIREGSVVKKCRVRVPDKVVGLLNCKNGKCISNDPRQRPEKIFYTIGREPSITLSCHYCDTLHSYERGNIELLPAGLH